MRNLTVCHIYNTLGCAIIQIPEMMVVAFEFLRKLVSRNESSSSREITVGPDDNTQGIIHSNGKSKKQINLFETRNRFADNNVHVTSEYEDELQTVTMNGINSLIKRMDDFDSKLHEIMRKLDSNQ